MFIKKITIKNFRLFPSETEFEINDINTPDGENKGSGLNVFVGENGCGKTALLEAVSLPLLQFKADKFDLDDFNNPTDSTEVRIFSEASFSVGRTMPKAQPFNAQGLLFKANIRARENRAYLSSIVVSDQLFIKADGVTSPADGSADLRVSVNNPFSGKRFDENDVLALDKARIYQTRLGTNNPTRFDRLMEDFNFQHIKKDAEVPNVHETLNAVRDRAENQFLVKTINKFEEISGQKLSLNLIDNWQPFSKGFLAVVKENHQQIKLSMLGSGFEMICSLLIAFFMAQQSGKQLIVLIDEPELHLHPDLQAKFVELLLEFSKDAQILLTTHSPLLVKQLFYNQNTKANVLVKDNDTVRVLPIAERLLPFISANEINFLAFNLPTEEYHNELYEQLKIKDDNSRAAPLNLKDFDYHFFQQTKGEQALYPYNNGVANEVSIHTHLRTQIHHRGTAGRADIVQIKKSIEAMRGFLQYRP